MRIRFLLVVLGLSIGVQDRAIANIPQSERDALIALYNSTGGPTWTVNTNWLGAPGTEGSWYGVTVSNMGTGDFVTKIWFMRNNLKGPIPPEIGNFQHLRELELGINELTGSIPSQIGSLTELEILELWGNEMTGPLPTEIGDLDRLTCLDLNYNSFNGPLTPLWGLPNLQYFDGRNNEFSGEIPPEFGRMNLTSFDVERNRLSGPIPSEIGNLVGLTRLYLAINAFAGEIPATITNLVNLHLYNGSDAITIWGNALYTNDPVVDAFLDSRIGGIWETGQTTPPTSVTATPGGSATNVLSILEASGAVTIRWKPIAFQAGDGGYQVLSSEQPRGPYQVRGMTSSKKASLLVVGGLTPGNRQYFVVQSVTKPNAQNSNTVISTLSAEVSCIPGGGGGSAPTISSVKPESGYPGTTIAVKGRGFSKTARKNEAYFGTYKAKVASSSSTLLRVLIPSSCVPGIYDVTVKVGGIISNSVSFVVK